VNFDGSSVLQPCLQSSL